MIDTDKYERMILFLAEQPYSGHFKPYEMADEMQLLLEEVKRLREELIELQEEHRLLGWKCATAVDWAEELGFYWCEECRSAQHEWCEYHDECEHCKENKHHCGCAEFMESDEYKSIVAESEEE